MRKTHSRIQTREPRGKDRGAVEESHYFVEGNTVILCNKDGVPMDKYKLSRKLVEGGASAHILAAVMVRTMRKPNSNFNRPLHYPKIKY